jgi:competence protein ComEC
MNSFTVKEIWDNGRIKYPQSMNIYNRHRALERGDVIERDSYKITVLHPYREFYTLFGTDYDEENDSSLVLKLSGRNSSFLFTGDIQEESETDLSHLKEWLSSDVIKVPHHGSRASAEENFFTAVSPLIAVISAGRDNAYGHPSSEVLERLSGKEIFRTDLDGAVKVYETEDGLAVKTYREFMFEKADGFDKEMNNIRKLFSKW